MVLTYVNTLAVLSAAVGSIVGHRSAPLSTNKENRGELSRVPHATAHRAVDVNRAAPCAPPARYAGAAKCGLGRETMQPESGKYAQWVGYPYLGSGTACTPRDSIIPGLLMKFGIFANTLWRLSCCREQQWTLTCRLSSTLSPSKF
jgi:hypothetical protein